jgi:hydrogenase expression/formation protein HypE
MKKNGKKSLKDDFILLSHGDGGAKTGELINNLIKKYFNNKILERLEDSAVFDFPGKKISFTTDSFVVDPIFFPGGDIGKLSICGTINDLVTSGCRPYALSFALILEEGFPVRILEKILYSMRQTLDEINTDDTDVKIVTGDTKVVAKGGIDKIYINTSGVGFIKEETHICPSRIKPGDLIIINGSIGEHGIAVLSKREGFDFKTNIKSDCASLNSLVYDITAISENIHALRDATRGGLARVLIELSQTTKLDFEIDITKIPIKKETSSICEFLGMDPLYIANEGKMVVIVDPGDADKVIQSMKNNKYGKDSRIIGKVLKKREGLVVLKTEIGTSRILDLHYSEQLPRIC